MSTRTRTRRRDERGSITPFVVIVSIALIMLAGLVVDGGRQLNAKGRALAYAQEAARAGSQAVDLTDPRLDLVESQALRAAAQYCAQAQAEDPTLVTCRPSIGEVQLPGGTFKAVQVQAQVRIDAILLGMIGKQTLQSSGTALARPVSGISDPDSGKQSTVPPPSVAEPSDAAPTATAPTVPPTLEVTPCTPKKDEDDDDKGGKGDKDKGDDPKKDDDPKDEDKPEECKTPEPGAG